MLSDPVLVALITAVPATVAAFVSLYNAVKIKEIKTATDGMKDALVASTRADALQEGHTKGVKDQKVQQAKDDREDAAKP